MNTLSKSNIISIINDIKFKSEKIYTNIYLNDWWLDIVDSMENVEYDYEEGKHLNIYLPEDRLYFVTNDVTNICNDKKKNIVLDYFGKIGTGYFMPEELGLNEYANYTKWNLKIGDYEEKHLTLDEKIFDIHKKVNDPKFYDLIYDAVKNNFDVISDNIPPQNFIFNDKIIYVCMDKLNDRLAGFGIYKLSGKNITTEYICVTSEYKGKGIATKIFDKLYSDVKSVKSDVKLFSSWIRDDNAISIGYHKSLGYKTTDIKKYTFTRGELWKKN